MFWFFFYMKRSSNQPFLAHLGGGQETILDLRVALHGMIRENDMLNVADYPVYRYSGPIVLVLK